MPVQFPPNRLSAWKVVGILVIVAAFFLAACGPGSGAPEAEAVIDPSTQSSPRSALPDKPTPSATEKPRKMAMPSATATATATPMVLPTERWAPTPFINSLEAFGMVYDPHARLEIPPWGSISMLFWGQEVPVQPIESAPRFISYPNPQLRSNSSELLIRAGCTLDGWGEAMCSPDSPLARFGCSWLQDPKGIDFGLEPKIPLVGVCRIFTEEHEAAKAGGLYLAGCAFKTEAHYIFKKGDEYFLVSSEDELKDLFLPLDSPSEALSFAQMVTGLDAMYRFTYDPTLMYFHEVIEGTHVTQNGGRFEMNLFHFQGCGCEPWINSQISIQVDRSGKIWWKDAVPISMTTGWGCAD